jgi:ribosome-binding factor A
MSIRKERLADEIRDIVGSFFQGGLLEDPRLQQVTITAAKISGDLQMATLYFRVFGDEKDMIAKAEKGLRSASPLFRRRLAEVLDLRRVPELRFFYDESIEHASKIEKLLDEIK